MISQASQITQHGAIALDLDRVVKKQPQSVEALRNRLTAQKGVGDQAGAAEDAERIDSLTRKPKRNVSLFSKTQIPATYSGSYSTSGNADYYRQRAIMNAEYEADRAMRDYRQHTAGQLGAMGF